MSTHISGEVWITIICWLLFSMTWMLQRNKAKENVDPRTASQKFKGFLGYVILFSLLYLPLFFAKDMVRVVPQNIVFQVLGVALCVIGVSVCIWSRLLLGWNWSGGVKAKKDHELIVKGPYRFVRHPIYSGFIVALTGTCLVVGGISGIVITVIYTLGLNMKIRQEEKLLAGLFDTYAGYKERTYKLIPFVW